MSTPPRNLDKCLECARVYAEAGSYRRGAGLLNMDRMTFKRHVVDAHKAYAEGRVSGLIPGFEISQKSEQRNADGEVTGTSVSQKPAASGKFNMPDGHLLKGVSSLVDGQGNVRQQWLKTSVTERDPIETARLISEAITDYQFTPIHVPEPLNTETELATIYPLADFHIGLLSWGKETGQDWDLDIARSTIIPAITRCVRQSPRSKHAVILGLGDMLHFDGYEPMTARSKNLLDADGRYPKVLKVAANMIVEAVSLALEHHETVQVRILPGNHDNQSAIALSLALSMKFENETRVEVDDSPSYFWWWEFGRNLIGATHGDKAKMKDLPLVMAADCKEAWGRTDYRKVFTGHIHHERRIEEGGVIVESLRSPVAKDAYHASERYRAGRSVYSETFHKSGGALSRITVNL